VLVDDVVPGQGVRPPAPPVDRFVTVDPVVVQAPAAPTPAAATATVGPVVTDAVSVQRPLPPVGPETGPPTPPAASPPLAGTAPSTSSSTAALPALLAELAATAAAAAEAMNTVEGDVQSGSAETVTGPVALRQSVPGVTGARDGSPSGLEAEHTDTRRVPARPAGGGGWASQEDLTARYAVVREQVDYALAEIALARAAFRRASEDDGPGWPFRDSELDVLRRPAVARALARELAGVERLRVWAQELYWLQEQHRGF
jgi:hypothetical protein